MIGFVVSAILSATLGQANDAFNWLAATLTKDMYVPAHKRVTGREPSEQKQLVVARMTMFIVGVLGIMVALYIPKLGGAFEFALQFYSLTAAFMMPVALGILYTRTPWWSGIASCSAAIVVALILMAFDVWSDQQPFVRNMLSESLVATLVFFGSTFWFKPDDPRNAQLQAFEKDLQTPTEDETHHDLSGLKAYRLIGTICFVFGGVLLACVFVPSTVIAPSSINVVAGAMLCLLGGAIFYYTRDRSIYYERS
jgi:Na+(H+)/acetate symporter ActP